MRPSCRTPDLTITLVATATPYWRASSLSLMLEGAAWISAQIFGVVVACLCSLMSISLLPDELLKKLLGGQQRITPIANLIIRDPTSNGTFPLGRVVTS